VRELDAQSGELTSGASAAGVRKGLGYGSTTHGDGGPAIEASTGTAARFFPQFPADEAALFGYHAKPSRAERDAGVEGDGNIHSTVKSISLMRWLIRLATKPGDVVLDPFCGSATTGVAALIEGRRFIGIERAPDDGEQAFAPIARARLEHAAPSHERLATMTSTPVRVEAADFGPLFNR
jgi:site-specific DNA-methyltransferase (adenine-specific)